LVCAAAALGATVPGMLAGPSDTINVATKPMTEQYIMGEALKMLIEHDTNLKVDLTEGVAGGTSNLEAGMESGQFDLYPEYTGTGWAAVLKNKGTYSEDEFDQLQADYNKKLDMSWVGMYGFGNTFGIAVRNDIVQKYDLKTYSDLAKVAGQLNLGAEPDFFEREDGYDALCSTYGMSFGKTTEMDAGLKYDALAQDSVDAIIIYTTDGKLSTADATVLTDDKGFFPSYQCGNVVRNQTLQEHPELRAELKKLQGTISEEDMARMNYEVEEEKKDPKAVAREFLSSKGLI
ncbi:glycine betaine ABC transporter substrate-binding protein, partial [Parafannyhessea umbonata]